MTLLPAATEGKRLRLRILNRRTGHPAEARWIEPDGAEADVARGYPKDANGFVLIEDRELDAIRLEIVRTIDIASFAPAAEVAPIWFDRPYFLAPSDKVGAEAYGVIRAAMAATGQLGLSRLVLARREWAVALQPREEGVVLWTLRFRDEVRDPEEALAEAPTDRPDPELARLARQLIRERTVDWDPAFPNDPVQDLIAARRKKRKPLARAPSRARKGGEVIDIMDALRRSLDADKG